ncbi:PXA domain-containing protein [Aspergillus ambiguus]|uniref:PXA domain-containing protein n=1 Tax=Aspergillus ambiguus TaxID=176160 RepID=UPI003CCD94C1
MSSDPPRPGLHPVSHLKAGPTTSSSRSTVSPVSSTLQQPSHSPRKSRQKHPSRDEPFNLTSDRATIALIRRILCPQSANNSGTPGPQTLEELPPLTSSNEVDRQLYALIAIIIKEFVLSWYSKITTDQALVNEVLQVIAHCTRALEQRLRSTDVAGLILDEIPALIESHIISYRLAKEQSHDSGFSPSLRDIYHTLSPHPGLYPVPDPSNPRACEKQLENEVAYRQLLVQGMLAVLLPTEDLENACLRTLVGDILADLILGNEVSRKICEGWFLWESVTKLLEAVGQSNNTEGNPTDTGIRQQNQLQRFGLLSPREDFQSGSSSQKGQLRIPDWVWAGVQLVYLTYLSLQFILTGLFRVASTPLGSSSANSASPIDSPDEMATFGRFPKQRPVLQYRVYSMVSQLLDVPRRMPWLGGLLALLQYQVVAGPGRLGDTGSVLDRFLRETIEEYLLTPTLLPNLLLASRAALFPSNARPPAADPTRPPQLLSVQPPAPPPERGRPPNDAPAANTASSSGSTPIVVVTAPSLSPDQSVPAPDIVSIKRQCAGRILSFVPRAVARRFFGLSSTHATEYAPPDCQGHPHLRPSSQDPSRSSSPASFAHSSPDDLLLLEAVEDEILDLFADSYCNKHLIYAIIETILAKLLPELSERSLTELMEDRGIPLASSRSSSR